MVDINIFLSSELDRIAALGDTLGVHIKTKYKQVRDQDRLSYILNHLTAFFRTDLSILKKNSIAKIQMKDKSDRIQMKDRSDRIHLKDKSDRKTKRRQAHSLELPRRE